MRQVEIFKLELMKLNPTDDEFPLQVDKLVESIPADLHVSLIPSIFGYFELHPLEECGMPGGLIHLIEGYEPEYILLLIESLRKVPSCSAILMLNRILNSQLSVIEREKYTAILIELSSKSGLHPELQKEAKDYIEYQSEKKS
jgi:hypothetical protein